MRTSYDLTLTGSVSNELSVSEIQAENALREAQRYSDGLSTIDDRFPPGTARNVISKVADIPYSIGSLLDDEAFPLPLNGSKFILSVNDSTHQCLILHTGLSPTKLAPIRSQLTEEYPDYNIITLVVENNIIRIMRGKWQTQVTNDGSHSELEAHFKQIIFDLNELSGRSDVHFELRFPPEHSRIRIRVDGILRDYMDMEANEMKSMLSIAYNVLGADKETGSSIQDNELQLDKAQDAKFVFGHNGLKFNLRATTIPVTIHRGLDLVLRYLDDETSAVAEKIEDLEYAPTHIALMIMAIKKPNGIIFITGVTGSGKSRTQAALINNLNEITAGTQKTYIIENPVERVLSNVTQINLEVNGDDAEAQLNQQITILKGKLMRADPDNIGTGEVRDKETADFAMSASATGHKCFTTCHTMDANGLISRLEYMGIERRKITADSSINLIVAQNLIPKVCPHCHVGIEKVSPTDREAIAAIDALCELGFSDKLNKLRFANPAGCQHCNKGLSGRTPAAEVMSPTPIIYDKWKDYDDLGAKREWLSKGGFTRLEHAIAKALDGLICPKSIALVGNILDSKSIRQELSLPLFDAKV